MKKRLLWIAIVTIGLVLVLIPLARWAQEFLASDNCLDRGGRWDYERHRCEGARS